MCKPIGNEDKMTRRASEEESRAIANGHAAKDGARCSSKKARCYVDLCDLSKLV
jgi:hypothetical protein